MSGFTDGIKLRARAPVTLSSSPRTSVAHECSPPIVIRSAKLPPSLLQSSGSAFDSLSSRSFTSIVRDGIQNSELSPQSPIQPRPPAHPRSPAHFSSPARAVVPALNMQALSPVSPSVPTPQRTTSPSPHLDRAHSALALLQRLRTDGTASSPSSLPFLARITSQTASFVSLPRNASAADIFGTSPTSVRSAPLAQYSLLRKRTTAPSAVVFDTSLGQSTPRGSTPVNAAQAIMQHNSLPRTMSRASNVSSTSVISVASGVETVRDVPSQWVSTHDEYANSDSASLPLFYPDWANDALATTHANAVVRERATGKSSDDVIGQSPVPPGARGSTPSLLSPRSPRSPRSSRSFRSGPTSARVTGSRPVSSLSGYRPLRPASSLSADSIVAAGAGTFSPRRMSLRSGGTVSALDQTNVPPLIAAAASGDSTLVNDLLRTGADVNVHDAAGRSALHVVGISTVLERLIAHGALLTLRDSSGNTPLHVQSRKGRADCVAMLLKHGAAVNEHNLHLDTPLHIAATAGHADVVGQLVRSGRCDVNARSGDGRTVTEIAVEAVNPELLQVLLQCKETRLSVQTVNKAMDLSAMSAVVRVRANAR
eukprot:TRINITY_DN11405_c0_g2_i1.p1 TRINITY_DN11405_c0_g2~~TRINITY_DN11405_c0_g2_i1.p1  ORF type:complete len:596 (-),score=100.00 TRINITY_DN11405_c0_g2_i1:193-1980(-)